MNININEIAELIADELMFENKDNKKVNDDSLEKECYLAVADIKADIKYETINILEDNDFEVI